jgi:hypothetical protein
MTSNENHHHDEQYGRHNHNDGNTSDDALLVDGDEKTPLLHPTSNGLVLREEILSNQSQTLATHCHVPDDKFDYVARNRLIVVLIICILFMIIEIAGTFFR